MRLHLALACLLALTAIARADIPPPETQPCRGQPVGAACEFGGVKGVCREATCSRATPDGSKEYDCRKCLPDAAASPALGTPVAPSQPAPDQPAPAQPAPAQPPPAQPAPAPAPVEVVAPKSSCATLPAGSLGSLAFALLAVRRKRRSR